MKLVPTAYLASYALSLLGNSIAAIALPLIVLQTTGSVLGAGIVAASTAVPAVVAGLVMGVVIDRINRLTSSVVTDLVSAAAIAALPLIDMVTDLDIGWFVLFGVLGSLGDVPGMTAREALLPAIVRHGDVSAERLKGLQEGLGAVTMLVGPAAAGTLMAVFSGPTVLWITAATSCGGALLTLLIPRRVGRIGADHVATTTTSGWSQLRDGWRTLFRSPFLVAVTGVTLASGFVIAALQGLVLPVYFTTIDRPGLLGLVLSALALGLLVGSGLFALGTQRVSRRTWFVTGTVGAAVGIVVIAALAGAWIVLVGAFVTGLASGLFTPLLGVLAIERIPEHLRGRVIGTQNAMMTAVPPLGIVLAAVFIEYGSLRIAAGVFAAVWVAAAAAALHAPALRTLEP